MARGKINNTSEFPAVTPADNDRLLGVNVSDTSPDADGEVVTFTVGSILSSQHDHTLSDITDAGSMAGQNSNNVTITGGSITSSNVTITGGSISGITDLAISDGGTGASNAMQALENLGLLDSEDSGGFTTGLRVPSGTEAQRPVSPDGVLIRYNSTAESFEGYTGTVWGAIGGGATGAGQDQIFYENDQNVTSSYTITSGKNAVTAGPVTIDNGVTVTVPTGSRWVVI